MEEKDFGFKSSALRVSLLDINVQLSHMISQFSLNVVTLLIS